VIPRFQNILVPVDFAEKNWSALDVVFDFAVHNRGAVTLLHVIETINNGAFDDDEEVQSFYRRLEDRAKRELETMGQRFVDAGLVVHERIRFGGRAVEIVSYSTEHACDLIVMSSHSLADRQPSSTVVTLSYQVSILCTCPVLLMK